MGLSITSGKGILVRDHVLACFDAQPEAVLTCNQVYSMIDIMEHKTDMADALRQMVANQDLELGPERLPGEPGGMAKGAGARPVKTYRRPVMTAGEREKLVEVLIAEVDPDQIMRWDPLHNPLHAVVDEYASRLAQESEQDSQSEESDPLFDVIDQLPLAARVPDGLQRAALAAAMSNAIPRLDAAHKAAIAAEEQAREIERLRQVEREAELMRAREQAATVARAEATAAADQRAREAAAQAEAELMRQERARLEAEQRARDAVANAQAQAAAAAQAERARIAAEQEREQQDLAERTVDREHQATIHREIVADLCEIGYTELAAKALVSLIAKRRIVHLRIEY